MRESEAPDLKASRGKIMTDTVQLVSHKLGDNST